MNAHALNIPDAVDLQTYDVNPARELESSNHLLNDHDALMRSYEENGYLLLRGVLDPGSVERARDEMLAVAVRWGLAEPGDKEGRWTGKPLPAGKTEESPEFAGVSNRLIGHPHNIAVMEKVLGEPACVVPIVQHRIYPPNSRLGPVHQDGFYSPGIQDYKPVWVPVTPCHRNMGGLMLAVGQNKRGYFHNIAKPTPFAIPVGVIPEESWATTDYYPGDVLIVHPHTPHAGGPNTSDRLRISFDTRVQSARNPSAFAATVLSVTPNTITVDGPLGVRTYTVDKDTYLRPRNSGVREPFEKFTEATQPGMRLVVVVEGERTAMLRKASEG